MTQAIIESLARLHPDLDCDLYCHGTAKEFWNAMSACSDDTAYQRGEAIKRLGPNDFAPDTADAAIHLRDLLKQWALPQKPLSAPLYVWYGGQDRTSTRPGRRPRFNTPARWVARSPSTSTPTAATIHPRETRCWRGWPTALQANPPATTASPGKCRSTAVRLGRVAAVGYPDNVLARDERVVLHRHPHWKRLIGPVLILLIVTALAAFGAGYVNQTNWDRTARNVVLIVIGVIWLLIIGWLTVWPFLNWWTTHFVITDRRVMFRHGLLTRSGIDIPLARINSVEFRHGLLDRMLRTGTLIIESASQDPLEFHDIPRVERVHSLLYHEVFDTLGSEEAPS